MQPPFYYEVGQEQDTPLTYPIWGMTTDTGKTTMFWKGKKLAR